MSQRPPRSMSIYAKDPMAFIEDLTIPFHGGVRFGDVMADFQRERFEALCPDLVATARRQIPPIGRHWWEATKGASKDSDLAAAVLWLLSFAAEPIRGQAGAADAGQASEIRLAANDLLHHNPWVAKRVRILRSEIKCDATGAWLDIESADAATSHGARPDFLVVNELHAIKSEEFARNLLDNADKVESCTRVIATNAGFLNTWQSNQRDIALDGEKTGDWFFHKYDKPAPWISAKALAESRRRNSITRYNRLWRGIWAAGTGDAIDEEDVHACVNLDRPGLVEAGMICLDGFDLGIKHDHSAHVVVGVKPGTFKVRLIYCESWAPSAESGHVFLPAVEAAVLEAHQKWGIACGFYDPTQASQMAQQLAAKGVTLSEMPFTAKNKTIMAVRLMEAFRNRQLELYPHDRLIADLFRLTIQDKGSHGYQLTATRDASGHADIATALAIVLPAALELAGAEPEPEEEDSFYRVVA